MPPDEIKLRDFQKVVTQHYAKHARSLPWRPPALPPAPDGSLDPYAIMVSESMLQQTQVSRVIPKFQTFMETFPTLQALATAPLSMVLTIWSGLGYNRRAKFLHAAAKTVVTDHGGTMPRTIAELTKLPGIGKNTAGAIMAYAFNEPVVFIETNIRSVYIHYFFHDQTAVSDAELLPFVEASLDRTNPREWYWALMDLGSMLKREVGNASRLSKHYSKQSRFEGSNRQLRGKILRFLLDGPLPQAVLLERLADDRSAEVLSGLRQEALVQINKRGIVSLPH